MLAWGFNGAGELGDGTFQDRHAPVKVQQLGGRVIKLFVSSVSGTADLLLAYVAVQKLRRSFYADVRVQMWQGGHHNLALLENGKLQAWGLGDRGQLGLGGRTSQPYPRTLQGYFPPFQAPRGLSLRARV